MTGSPARPSVEADQLAKLNALLREILPSNEFYRSKLSGIRTEFESLDAFSRTVPFTRKQELAEDQLAHPKFGTILTYPIERYSRFCQTSSTTGKPLRWLDTTESWSWMLDCWSRVFEESGVTAADRVFCAFSFGPFLGFWLAFEAAARMGCLCIPGGGLRSAARLSAMLDLSATVLCCTPTYAIRLAEVAAEEKIDISASPVRKLMVAGEPGGSIPGTRRRIEELWPGAQVVDHHGMTEIGPVTYGCRKRGGVLHVIESAYVAEVIDPLTLAEAPAGSAGELVLTNLGRTGSPLLRYRTGDMVQRGENAQCECGTWDLALEGGIIGRTDDMVVVRGVNVYPSAVEDVLRACGGVAEYRVEVQTGGALTDVRIQVEPAPDHAGDGGLSHRIEADLRNSLSLRIPVEVVAVGTLPRFEMKAKRWVRV